MRRCYIQLIEKIRVVLDNLNRHTPASLYEAFPHTPKRQRVHRLKHELEDMTADRAISGRGRLQILGQFT